MLRVPARLEKSKSMSSHRASANAQGIDEFGLDARTRQRKEKNMCRQWSRRASLTLFAALLGMTSARAERDPLPSWNSGAAKQAILSFVRDATTRTSPKYVAPADR